MISRITRITRCWGINRVQGDKGAWCPGPQGITGDKGQKGEVGPQGNPGVVGDKGQKGEVVPMNNNSPGPSGPKEQQVLDLEPGDPAGSRAGSQVSKVPGPSRSNWSQQVPGNPSCGTFSGDITVPKHSCYRSPGTYDIGSSSVKFGTMYANTSQWHSNSAQYADLAENYVKTDKS